MKATNSELAQQLFHLFGAIAERSDNSFFKALEESGLTPSGAKTLKLLQQQEQAVSPSFLAEHMNLSLPTVSRIIDTLVAKGFVLRAIDDKDRRARKLTISEKGSQLLTDIYQARLTDLNTFTDGLPPKTVDALSVSLSAFLKDIA